MQYSTEITVDALKSMDVDKLSSYHKKFKQAILVKRALIDSLNLEK